jgi:hypothetical protein
MVQTLPSSQFNGGFEHWPVTGSHTSSVQRSPSPQSVEPPWQTTPPSVEVTQASPCVQAFASSQFVPATSGLATHSPASLQASSVVQEFRSSQGVPPVSAVPWHCAASSQTSFRVQEFRSSH